MKTILLIEDEPDMRRNICTILELENFQVLSAGNGRDGLDLARTKSPDLVVCDVMMPGLDGYQVLQALREDKNTTNLPFIFLTAKGEKADFRTGMNHGADDYLAKPVSATELLTAVNVRLERAAIQEKTAEFRPNFDSPEPLQALGLTPRESEVLLWVAQGKSNADIATILGMSEATVKKHLEHVFEKLGVESRNAATLCALEALSSAA